MAKTVVALFDRVETAQDALRALMDNGFSRDEISLVANENDEHVAGAERPAGTSGAGEGAGIGAVLGGLGGLLVGLGALAIPGIGPVLAAGPLAAALAGAGIGAVTGGLIGALVDAGIPEEEARYYSEGVRRGGTLVTVRAPEDRYNMAAQILNRFGPVDIHQRATQWQETGWTGTEHTTMGEHSTTMPTYDQGMTDRNTSRDWSQFDDDFRRNHEKSYNTSGFTYDQMQPAYRYGYELNDRPNYRGRQFADIEADARRDWEMQHPNSTWDSQRSAVEYGWQRGSSGYQGNKDYNFSNRGEQMNSSADRGANYSQGTGTNPSDPRFTGGDALSGGQLQDTDRVRSYDRDNDMTGDSTMNRSTTGGQSFDAGMASARTGQSPDRGEGPMRDRSEFRDTNTGQTGSSFRNTESTGFSNRSGSGMAGDYDYDTGFRSHFDKNYGNRGFTYDSYQPAYRYGSTLASNPSYRGRDWRSIEADARYGWERDNPDTPWDNVKDAVRHAWDSVTGHNG